tara:strand:- start:1465 stop:1896 length:432 start_codon:yes stop_codon:yes gene_type:complete
MKTVIAILICLHVLWVGADVIKNERSRQMFEAAMKQREKCGLSKQVLDKKLCDQANNWARYMASIERMVHGGGEQIIAKGYSTPEAAINAWMRSDGHRRWLLCNRSHVGFGYAVSKNGRKYYAGVYRNKNQNKIVPFVLEGGE